MDSNRIPAVIVTALGAAAIGLAGCGGTAQAKKPDAADKLAVKTTEVQRIELRRSVEAVGTLAAHDQATVSAAEQKAALEQTRSKLGARADQLPPPGRTPDVLSATAKLVPVAYSLTEEARDRLKTSRVRAALARRFGAPNRPASEPLA